MIHEFKNGNSLTLILYQIYLCLAGPWSLLICSPSTDKNGHKKGYVHAELTPFKEPEMDSEVYLIAQFNPVCTQSQDI
jgi:hypothetical protein